MVRFGHGGTTSVCFLGCGGCPSVASCFGCSLPVIFGVSGE